MMNAIQKSSIEVEAELISPNAEAQLIHYHFAGPPNGVLKFEEKVRIEMCLTARHRSARACYSDLWSPQRYERIGDIFVVSPQLEMLARSDEDTPLTSVVCLLNIESIMDLFEQIPDVTDKLLLTSLNVQNVNTRNLLLRLAEELRQPGFASKMMVESIATQMAVELVRLCVSIADDPLLGGGLAPWQLHRIEARLTEVNNAPTLLELAELCRISIRQLTRSFRASRGYSVGSYVAYSQFEHAKQMLATGESVASIAATLGFSSASNFSVAFRRAMGLTPGQFRQRLLRAG